MIQNWTDNGWLAENLCVQLTWIVKRVLLKRVFVVAWWCCCMAAALQWCHNERGGISNHQSHDCLLSCLFKEQIKENIKDLCHWPLWGEFTSDLWIPHTKGQQCGKCFHLMTSSWSLCPACHVYSVACCPFHGLYSYVAQIQPMRGWCVTYHFQVYRSRSHGSFKFCSRAGYPSRSPIYNF